MIGCLRHAGLSIEMTAHAYSVLDSYIYGFAHVEMDLPFDTADETKELADTILHQLPADEYPHIIEFTTEHVLQPGYDYGDEFEFGLDLILDGLERSLQEHATRWSGGARTVLQVRHRSGLLLVTPTPERPGSAPLGSEAQLHHDVGRARVELLDQKVLLGLLRGRFRDLAEHLDVHRHEVRLEAVPAAGEERG